MIEIKAPLSSKTIETRPKENSVFTETKEEYCQLYAN